MTAARPFCAAASSVSHEPLAATASRVDHWILLEHRGVWARDAPRDSTLSAALRTFLREQLDALSHARLLFVKQPERRRHGCRVLLGTSQPGRERFFALDVEHDEDLRGLDLASALTGGDGLGVAIDQPLFLVCTHGKHDRCCARHGRPLYDALRHETDPEHVWQSTHVGGDRFAGNVVVLPHGLYYGRVAPADVAGLVAACASGRVDLGRYRGRSAYAFPVQAAEQALRESLELSGLGDLELVETTRHSDDPWRVRFRTPDGAVHEVDVAPVTDEEPRYLTCNAAEARRTRRYVTTVRP